MTELDRRTFLKRSAFLTAGAAIAGGPLAGFLTGTAIAGTGHDGQNVLRDVPDLADGAIRLSLPDGFQYRSFHQSRRLNPAPPNVELDDGSFLPGRHDGMAAFAGPQADLVTLIRNHEENGSGLNGSFGAPGTPTYDTSALGGTSTVHVSYFGEVEFSYASLSGTQMNCSGGQMPWGSWITCEETVNGYDVGDDFTRGPRYRPRRTSRTPGSRRTTASSSRCRSAAARRPSRSPTPADSRTSPSRGTRKGGALYLSEDNFAFPSGFYKYVPPEDPKQAGRLLDGGRLYMLKVVGSPNADLAVHLADGTTFAVEWVEIDEPSFDFGRPAPGRRRSGRTTRASSLSAARGWPRAPPSSPVSRARSTTGALSTSRRPRAGSGPGPTQPDSIGGFGKGWGQIWAFDTRNETLHMLFESPSREVLDFPDNVTTSPQRDAHRV